jgi:hypothetical protein
VPYATTDDVAALSPARTFSATSHPTATQVQIFLRDTAAELDAVAAVRGYSVPVPTSATIAYNLMRAYNAKGAHCLVEKTAPTGRKDAADEACAAWTAAKKALAEGDVLLPDVAVDDDTGRVRSGFPASAMFTASGRF